MKGSVTDKRELTHKEVWDSYAKPVREAVTGFAFVQVAIAWIGGGAIPNVILRTAMLVFSILYHLVMYWTVERKRQKYVAALDTTKKVRDFLNFQGDFPIFEYLRRQSLKKYPVNVETVHVTNPRDGFKVPVKIFSKNKHSIDDPGCILYIHGGGMILFSVETYEEHIRKIAHKTDVAVIAIDYRLAPETPFPGAAEDCYAVYEWLIAHGKEHGISTNKIVVMGDSAGGYLVGSMTVRAIQERKRIPDGCLFLYTWSGEYGHLQSHKRLANDILIPSTVMKTFARSVSRGLQQTQRKGYSPHEASDEVLKQFPKSAFFVGDCDPLQDDTLHLHSKFKEANVDTTLTVMPGYCHACFMIPLKADIIKEAEKNMITWIRDIIEA